MTDIFISYNHEDRDKAKILAEIFVRRGYDVWWDVSLCIPGQNFSDEINEVLKKARTAIVLWSDKSINSMWVKSEAALALEKGILLPVWLEKVDLPLPFNSLHTIDLSHWNGKEENVGLDELLSSVVSVLGQPIGKVDKYSDEEVQELLEKPGHEVDFWKSICSKAPPSVDEYKAYIETYGKDGAFSKLAQLRIEQINSEKSSSKLGLKVNKTLAVAGVIVGIFVGAFQIADMLDWLPSKGEKISTGITKVDTILEKEDSLSDSCKELFVNNCGKGSCTTVRLPDVVGAGLPKREPECDDMCVQKIEKSLLKNHISYLRPSRGASVDHTNCIGFREDLGGTYVGAKCLVSLLGDGFKVGNCKGDGWPYSINLY